VAPVTRCGPVAATRRHRQSESGFVILNRNPDSKSSIDVVN